MRIDQHQPNSCGYFTAVRTDGEPERVSSEALRRVAAAVAPFVGAEAPLRLLGMKLLADYIAKGHQRR